MIIGKTKEEVSKQRLEYIQSLRRDGFPKFAWLPVKLQNGQYVWLERYWSFLISHPYDIRELSMRNIRKQAKFEKYTRAEATIKKLTQE